MLTTRQVGGIQESLGMPPSFEPGTLESCGAGNFVGGFGMGWYPRPWVCALPSFGKRVFSAVLVRVSSRWKEKETTFPAHLAQGSGWRKKGRHAVLWSRGVGMWFFDDSLDGILVVATGSSRLSGFRLLCGSRRNEMKEGNSSSPPSRNSE